MQGFRRIATVRAAVLRNSARSQHSGVDVAGHAQVAHATYPANTGNAGPAQAAAAVNSASIPSAGPVAGVGSAEKESSGGNEGFENDAARWQQAVQELGEIKTSGPLVEWFLQYFPRATYQHWFASAAHHNVQSLVQDMAMQVCCEGCTHISTTAMVAKQPVDLNEVHDVVSLVRLLAFDYRCNVPPFVRHAVVELLLALPLSARCAALHRDLSVLAYLVDEFARSGAVGNRLPAQLASSLATAMQLVARDLGAERQRAQELDLAVRKETERVTSFGANQSRMRQLEHSQSAGQSPHEGDPRVKRIQFQRREKISKLRLSQLHTQHQQQMQREQRLAGGVAVTVGVFNAMKAHVADHVVLGDALQELIAHAPAHHYSVHFLSEVLDMFPADPR
ncbi:uncharacterized protein LOC135818312 [Sycon ciliatum]|uniref:uncharacterized protein LOC135818312 n=1 Tax=Sycon ciliatum TaxID=27933 RepID=UPI0031F6EB9C